MSKIRIIEWKDAPDMNAGAPMPSVSSDGSDLFVAYLVSDSENDDEYAIVKFKGVLQFTFGYPNDEALVAHPLYKNGLKFYSFNEIENSPAVNELDARNASVFPNSKGMYCSKFRHWVATFHDETLEVIGSSIDLIGQFSACSSEKAIIKHIEKMPSNKRH